MILVVSFAAVFGPSRNAPPKMGALRDGPKNGCEGDYDPCEQCVYFANTSSDQI